MQIAYEGYFNLPVRGELLLERSDRVGEHLLVRRRSRRDEIGFRARERELDRPALRLRIAFLGRQRGAGLLPALSLRLLELDVLALEASRHHLESSVLGPSYFVRPG